MSSWLYPTHFDEREKSYFVVKFGRVLFFPKSIIEGREEYDFEHGSKGSYNHHWTNRCKFLMPEWYIKKYKIQHWDNIHMKSGKTWDQHFNEKYNEGVNESPQQKQEKLQKGRLD